MADSVGNVPLDDVTVPPVASSAARLNNKVSLGPYLWILPGILILVAFLFYPIAFSTILSLFEWNGINQNPFETFVGTEHYASLVKDRFFKTSLTNSLILVLAVVTVQIGIALLLAIFIFMGKFKGGAWVRGIIFFPSVLSAVVVGLVWRNVIFLRGGMISRATETLDLPAFYPLGDPDIAFYSIVLVAIWQGIGFNLVIFFAGLQSLNQDVLESAMIDGANFWRTIYHVIVPLQRHVILVSVMLNVIGGFQVFDLIFVLSKGAMANAHITDVLSTYMLFNSLGGSFFGFGGGRRQVGYASAIAIVMMVLMLIMAVMRNRARKAIDY